MKVILFGATGMVGQGVLRECLLDPEVERVLDFSDFTDVADELVGYDACLYCLGVSSVGMSEADYTRVTYDFTMAAARTLATVNPELTFIYISGQGTNGTERGRSMWARVKGRTENALIALLPNAYAFRPGFIQPVHGARSKTRSYRLVYAVTAPLAPLLRRLFPRGVTTTEQLALAMLRVAKHGYPKRVLENRDLVAVASSASH
jgi:uncharacterized protein YbjT (DUF2867 family)